MLVKINQKVNERQVWEMLLLRYPYDTAHNHREAMRIFSFLAQYGNIGFDVVVTDNNKNASKNNDGWKCKHVNLKEGIIEEDMPAKFNISLKYVDPLSTNKIKNLMNEWILTPEHAMIVLFNTTLDGVLVQNAFIAKIKPQKINVSKSDIALGMYDMDVCFDHEFILGYKNAVSTAQALLDRRFEDSVSPYPRLRCELDDEPEFRNKTTMLRRNIYDTLFDINRLNSDTYSSAIKEHLSEDDWDQFMKLKTLLMEDISIYDDYTKILEVYEYYKQCVTVIISHIPATLTDITKVCDNALTSINNVLNVIKSGI